MARSFLAFTCLVLLSLSRGGLSCSDDDDLETDLCDLLLPDLGPVTEFFEITGSMNFDVPDASAFVGDPANELAVESGIAVTFGLNSSWVDATLVAVRRLEQQEAAWSKQKITEARRLAAVSASYVISIPNATSYSSVTKDTVQSMLTTAASDDTSSAFTSLENAIVAAVSSATGTNLTVLSFVAPVVTVTQTGTTSGIGGTTSGIGGTTSASNSNTAEESDVSAGASLIVGFSSVLPFLVTRSVM